MVSMCELESFNLSWRLVLLQLCNYVLVDIGNKLSVANSLVQGARVSMGMFDI